MKLSENTIAIAGGIFVILILIFGTAFNVSSAQKETQSVAESVSTFYIEELATRRVSIISDTLKQNFQYINNALDSITKADLSSTESLRHFLGKIRRLYGVEKFSFVDEDLLVYSEHSTITGKSRYSFLSERLSEPLVTTVVNYGGEKLLFIAVPVYGIEFNGKMIRACFAQVNIDQMVRSMTFRADDMETYFNLYLKNGESLTNAPFGGVEPGRNLFAVIHENDESLEKFHKIVDDFQNERKGNLNVPYKRQNAHLYYAPVEQTGWMLSILVYDNVINHQIQSSNRIIMARNHTQILIAVLSVTVLFIIFIIMMRKNSRMVLEQEKRIATETKNAYDKLNKETQGMQIIHSIINSGPWSIEFNEQGQVEKCIWSQPFRQMLGYNSEEEFPNVLDSWANLLHPEDKPRVWKAFWDAVNDYSGNTIYDVEYRLQTKYNGWRWYHAAGNLIRKSDGSPVTYVGLFIDIDEKKSLKVLSETDQMTGLLNRVSGEKRVAEALKQGNGGLFILLDIDSFKFFNDTFGHGVGDQVIINVARCLKQAFREEDVVFRLGGDEFSAYAPHVQDEKTAKKVIKRFTDNLTSISIAELEGRPVTASIGAVIIEEGKPADFAENYKRVDEGVYESKKVKGESAVTFK